MKNYFENWSIIGQVGQFFYSKSANFFFDYMVKDFVYEANYTLKIVFVIFVKGVTFSDLLTLAQVS